MSRKLPLTMHDHRSQRCEFSASRCQTAPLSVKAPRYAVPIQG
jgi:hypothetical protein